MRNTFVLISLMIFASVNFSAQTQNWAPVVWERYKTLERGVSFMLPKMPTLVVSQDRCKQTEIAAYFAYAEGSVYEVRIFSKNNVPRPLTCTEDPRPWKESDVKKRVADLRKATKSVAEESISAGGLRVHKFTEPGFSRMVVSDISRNGRWIELGVRHYENERPNLDRFFDSLVLTTDSGKEIGDGAPSTLGDPPPAAAVKPDVKDSSVTGGEPGKKSDVRYGSGSGPGNVKRDVSNDKPLPRTSVTFVSKPTPPYTDEARRTKIEGTVRLKVTFLSNGAIGSVTPVTGLPYGLTEQAITAARKVAFLPKRINRVPVSVVMTFEYAFSIY